MEGDVLRGGLKQFRNLRLRKPDGVVFQFDLKLRVSVLGLVENGFDDLRRCSGAQWKRGPVEWFTGRRWNGADPPSPSFGAANGGNGLHWRSQAPSPTDVSVEHPPATHRRSRVPGERAAAFVPSASRGVKRFRAGGNIR